ncbi:hypothetical protein TRFO_08654 [Tritrichomonas foetus]|uniref:Uncharacterized protein n=1 Tax=Tritrichomonas foetus TaxID=1144522 RepID=A0A1J4JIV0_9EUKA|nr:hypothetical protein TRFO_08654 [Tritrichomonas foetus]|eukprot:OHS99078.1 hypothetical protein TRFO_08654 [Tritrichomonas foetus]
MFVFIFAINAYGFDQLTPLQDAIEGLWNVSRIEITNDGLENPDVANFSFTLENPENNVTYISKLTKTSSNDDQVGNISINFSVDFISENFTLFINDFLRIENKFVTSVDFVRRCVGATNNPNFSYSFVFLSSYRAELTIFNRETGEVTVYRFWKQFHAERMSGFSKYVSYIFRKSLFRMI